MTAWAAALATGSGTMPHTPTECFRRSPLDPREMARGSYDLGPRGTLSLLWRTGRELVARWDGQEVACGEAEQRHPLPFPYAVMPLRLDGVDVGCERQPVEPRPRSPLRAREQLVATAGDHAWTYTVRGPRVPRPDQEVTRGTHRAELARADGTVLTEHRLPPLLDSFGSGTPDSLEVAWVEGITVAELVISLMWTTDGLYRGVAPAGLRTANLDFW